MFFITKEAKETILDFSQEAVKKLKFDFVLIYYPNKMTQYPSLNVKLILKNLKISSNVVDDSNDENEFPHKLLFTITQFSKRHKAFVNGSSANIKLLKSQLHKIRQSGECLSRLLKSLQNYL